MIVTESFLQDVQTRLQLGQFVGTGVQLRRGESAEQLAVRVRRKMQRRITELVAPDGMLYALQLAGDAEEILYESPGDAKGVVLSPDQAATWRQLLAHLVAQSRRPDRPLVLLCSGLVRQALEPVASGLVPDLVVVEPDAITFWREDPDVCSRVA